MSMRRFVTITCFVAVHLTTWSAYGASSQVTEKVALVRANAAIATVVVPDAATPIAMYAAEELVTHVEKAAGVRLPVVKESEVPESAKTRIYIGSTRSAAALGIVTDALASETFVLRTTVERLFIAANDGPGDPLNFKNTFSGSLWGVYEVIERDLGVRWLWPGELGTFVPRTSDVRVGPYDETVPARLVLRNLRPGIDPKGPSRADVRLAFSQPERDRYAHEQTVFLRRHRMGRSSGTYFSEPSFQSGHCFEGWWERYGKEHPEWFQLLPDGRRGPSDPAKPNKVSMCVSNPELQRKIVELWKEERAKQPGKPLNIGVGENDVSAECQCPNCKAWDGPSPNLDGLPPGLERSYLPVQAGTRYARFAKTVQVMAAEIDPHVKASYYAYLNYFWAPAEDITLSPNIVIGFVPWFRWAGWFPRTEAEDEWIRKQWLGWQRTGASLYYRPNWFLDGYSMPHIYPHQFASTFQFYAKHGMIGTDFDSLQGQWAAQGPNLYLLARIHVRPDTPVDKLLEEYNAAFGPAAGSVREYFKYWEDYSIKNRERAANAIRTRRDGVFRRYALYAQVADELYPLEVFPPAVEILQRARAAVQHEADPQYARRVAFLEEGLKHATLCVETAKVMNNPGATVAERSRAIEKLAAYRRGIASMGTANLDRLALIETDSWKDTEGFQTGPAK